MPLANSTIMPIVQISRQQVAFQFRNVIDFSYCDDGELAQMRVYHDRLLGKLKRIMDDYRPKGG